MKSIYMQVSSSTRKTKEYNKRTNTEQQKTIRKC